MRNTGTIVLVLMVGFAALPSSAPARGLEKWPYERLFKAADLVVIARPTGSADCADRCADNLWKQEFIGVNTTLKVAATLKGKPPGETIKVLHFRVRDGVAIEHGP